MHCTPTEEFILAPPSARGHSSLALSLLIVLAGCDRFLEPSREECEMSIRHAVRIKARVAVDSPLAAQLLGSAINLRKSISGDREEAINTCIAKSTRAQVMCVLGAQSSRELQECD